MGGSKLIASLLDEHPEITDQIYPEDTYTRLQRQSHPDRTTQRYMLPLWRLHSRFLDIIVPNHNCTLNTLKVHRLLTKSCELMQSTNCLDKEIHSQIIESLDIQREFLINAEKLGGIVIKVQTVFSRHLSVFGDPEKDDRAVWNFYEMTVEDTHEQSLEGFLRVRTMVMKEKKFLKEFMDTVKDCYESTLDIIGSTRSIIDDIEQFVNKFSAG